MDPIELQVVTGALRATCEEMGAVLIRSAHSANIKERRDASTALFDAAGEMVMQAEHIPVHLGAMPASVAAVLGEAHAPGRSWVLNNPYRGGTHLPDITVITPVFAGGWARSSEPIAFVANRAHHADVGGPTPGSMPADSTRLADEGVVIEPRVLDDEAIAELSGLMRRPEQRRADLRAQLAAGRAGVGRLLELQRRIGSGPLREAFAEVLDYAERRTRACLREIEDGVRTASDVLEAREGDLPIELRATVSGDELTLDFSGSADRHQGNLNCPEAVTRSACYFALRVLTDPDIPPSAGAYRPVTVIAPEGSLLNARATRGDDGGYDDAPAVVGGNVETSSRVADVVLRAFGHALGQGTMNNVTLGDEDTVYYETIGGGQGACADADGPSGVHVAMSNTLNTPVEALELEFPMRVVRYELRRGSGGDGEHHGGDGVIRELEALAELRYSLITERRRHAPPGAAGGHDGTPGRNLLDGAELGPKAIGTLQRGSRLRIETPGGGGYGRPGDGGHDRPGAAATPGRATAARACRAAPAASDRAAASATTRDDHRMSQPIAFIGLGIMGSRMAANLAAAGHELRVWNRTASTAERFAAEHRATVAATPAQAADGCQLVFTMVVDGDQVRDVLLSENGAAAGAQAGTIMVDCSTIGPAATLAIGSELAERGLSLVDAPVTGSSPKAQDGTLTFMVGATDEQFATIEPALDVMGELIVHAGPLGQGQMVKLINNATAAANAATLAQALIVGSRADVDLGALVTVMGAGAGGSAMLDLKAGPMRRHDYSTLFKLEHMLKDVRLCLDEGQRLGVPFPSAAFAHEVLNAGMGMGHADDDFAAMLEPLEGLAGTRL